MGNEADAVMGGGRADPAGDDVAAATADTRGNAEDIMSVGRLGSRNGPGQAVRIHIVNSVQHKFHILQLYK